MLLSALALALAAASPALRLAPPSARPGDAVLVTVEGAAARPEGTLAGRPLAFWRDGDAWRALAALPIELPPGEAPVDVEAGGEPASARLAVVDPGFPSRRITVPDRYVEPPARVRRRIAADRAAFARAYDRAFGPPGFARPFGWPREAPTTGRYGDRRVFNDRKASVHYGVDLAGPVGAAVTAANDGEVVLARDCYMSGRSVVLSHGAGVFTSYFHLDRIDVRAGQRVARGERVGRLGSTGRANGPHLHWGARVDGLLVDPESLVGIDFASGTAPPREARLPEPPLDEARPEGVEAPPDPAFSAPPAPAR